jgi:hypothetical protein
MSRISESFHTVGIPAQRPLPSTSAPCQPKTWGAIITQLAQNLHEPEPQIAAILQSEIQQLERISRVKSFVGILAVRRVRKMVKVLRHAV